MEEPHLCVEAHRRRDDVRRAYAGTSRSSAVSASLRHTTNHTKSHGNFNNQTRSSSSSNGGTNRLPLPPSSTIYRDISRSEEQELQEMHEQREHVASHVGSHVESPARQGRPQQFLAVEEASSGGPVSPNHMARKMQHLQQQQHQQRHHQMQQQHLPHQRLVYRGPFDSNAARERGYDRTQPGGGAYSGAYDYGTHQKHTSSSIVYRDETDDAASEVTGMSQQELLRKRVRQRSRRRTHNGKSPFRNSRPKRIVQLPASLLLQQSPKSSRLPRTRYMPTDGNDSKSGKKSVTRRGWMRGKQGALSVEHEDLPNDDSSTTAETTKGSGEEHQLLESPSRQQLPVAKLSPFVSARRRESPAAASSADKSMSFDTKTSSCDTKTSGWSSESPSTSGASAGVTAKRGEPGTFAAAVSPPSKAPPLVAVRGDDALLLMVPEEIASTQSASLNNGASFPVLSSKNASARRNNSHDGGSSESTSSRAVRFAAQIDDSNHDDDDDDESSAPWDQRSDLNKTSPSSVLDAIHDHTHCRHPKSILREPRFKPYRPKPEPERFILKYSPNHVLPLSPQNIHFRDQHGQDLSPIQPNHHHQTATPRADNMMQPISHYTGHPAEKHLQERMMTFREMHGGEIASRFGDEEDYPDPPMEINMDDDDTVMSAFIFIETVASIVIQTAVRRFLASQQARRMRRRRRARQKKSSAKELEGKILLFDRSQVQDNLQCEKPRQVAAVSNADSITATTKQVLSREISSIQLVESAKRGEKPVKKTNRIPFVTKLDRHFAEVSQDTAAGTRQRDAAKLREFVDSTATLGAEHEEEGSTPQNTDDTYATSSTTSKVVSCNPRAGAIGLKDPTIVSADQLDIFHLSATKIQAAFRGFWVRDCLDVDHYCASSVQKAYRGYACRKMYQSEMARVVVVQSWARRNIVRAYAANLLAYVIAIQATLRGHRVRNQYRSYRRHREQVSNRAATAIQSRWRTFVCEAHFVRDLVDILIVQTVVRRWLARQRVVFVRSLRYKEETGKQQNIDSKLRSTDVRPIGEHLRHKSTLHVGQDKSPARLRRDPEPEKVQRKLSVGDPPGMVVEQMVAEAQSSRWLSRGHAVDNTDVRKKQVIHEMRRCAVPNGMYAETTLTGRRRGENLEETIAGDTRIVSAGPLAVEVIRAETHAGTTKANAMRSQCASFPQSVNGGSSGRLAPAMKPPISPKVSHSKSVVTAKILSSSKSPTSISGADWKAKTRKSTVVAYPMDEDSFSTDSSHKLSVSEWHETKELVPSASSVVTSVKENHFETNRVGSDGNTVNVSATNTEQGNYTRATVEVAGSNKVGKTKSLLSMWKEKEKKSLHSDVGGGRLT